MTVVDAVRSSDIRMSDGAGALDPRTVSVAENTLAKVAWQAPLQPTAAVESLTTPVCLPRLLRPHGRVERRSPHRHIATEKGCLSPLRP